jgi:hypothetical protein
MNTKLSKQAQYTYTKIQYKAREAQGHRFPSLRMIAKLLDELNIENHLDEWSETKWRENGLRYHTSGGGYYEGWRLQVPEIRMEMISTDTYYSWNTWNYARELEKLIKSKRN